MSETPTATLQLLYSVPSLGLDDSKGPPSFIFVTHEIPLPEFPYTFPEEAGFFITNGWLGSPGQHSTRMLLQTPDGQTLADTGERPIDLPDSHPYTAITFLQGLTFPEPGLYQVLIWGDGQEFLRFPLRLTLAPDPELLEIPAGTPDTSR